MHYVPHHTCKLCGPCCWHVHIENLHKKTFHSSTDISGLWSVVFFIAFFKRRLSSHAQLPFISGSGSMYVFNTRIIAHCDLSLIGLHVGIENIFKHLFQLAYENRLVASGWPYLFCTTQCL